MILQITESLPCKGKNTFFLSFSLSHTCEFANFDYFLYAPQIYITWHSRAQVSSLRDWSSSIIVFLPWCGPEGHYVQDTKLQEPTNSFPCALSGWDRARGPKLGDCLLFVLTVEITPQHRQSLGINLNCYFWSEGYIVNQPLSRTLLYQMIMQLAEILSSEYHSCPQTNLFIYQQSFYIGQCYL